MPQAHERTLFLSVSVDGKRYVKAQPNLRKIAPGAYAVLVPEDAPDRVFWGEGYARDTHPLFAHGIMHILDDVLLDEIADASDPANSFALNVVVQKPGAGRFLEEYAEKWIANAKRNSQGEIPSNLPVWERLYNLSRLGKIRFSRAKGATDLANIRTAHKTASQKRKAMPDCPTDVQEGVVNTGESGI